MLLVTEADHVLVIVSAPLQLPTGVVVTSVKLIAGGPQLVFPATAVATPVAEGVVLLPMQTSTFVGQVIVGAELHIQTTVTLKSKVATLPHTSITV